MRRAIGSSLALVSRIAQCAVLTAIMMLVGCDENSNPFASTDDEQAFLTSDFFTKPFMLHLGKDAFASAQLAASMGGVDNRPTNGALYNTINFLPCRALTDQPYLNSMWASIDGYPFRNDGILGWLAGKHLLEFRNYPIHYSQILPPGGYGTDNTFICPVVLDAMRQYLPPNQQGQSLHDGIEMPLLYRKFTAWTYRNRYETQIFGMGKVKIFAGTFTYTMATVIPGVYVSTAGTGSVKVLLNPDTGKWQVDSTQFQDPPVSLQ